MKPSTELLLGGSWHDFSSFAELVEATLGPVAQSYDIRGLRRLASIEPGVLGPQVIVLYTCLDETRALKASRGNVRLVKGCGAYSFRSSRKPAASRH